MRVSSIPKNGSELDLDVDTGSEIELHQRVHRLRGRIDDIEQALVRAHLELLAALLVDVRRPVDRELLDPGRQRNRPAHLRAGALRRVDDFARRRVEDAVVERLEPDADVLAVHLNFLPASCRAEPAISKRRGWPGMSPAMTQRLLLDDARDDAGADGAATLADREAQFFFHRD